jgi:mannan endo-1,4-beta-mannosidase
MTRRPLTPIRFVTDARIPGGLLLGLILAGPVGAQALRYEAESGALSGVSIGSSVAGYSGSGYVTGFDVDTDKITIQANAPAGMYELWVRYRSSSGKKGYGFQVGAERGDGSFNGTTAPQPYQLDRAGLFELTGGPTSLQILKGWGYYDVDYLELRPATPHAPAPVAPTLIDPSATPHAQYLMDYLGSLYGQKTLAGQQGNVGQGGDFPSTNYLSASGGLTPALRGSDFIDYSPSRIANGASPAGESERIIDWARKTGGVVSMMWHWNAPSGLINQPGKEWWRGFYTDSTTFDVQAALANPASTQYGELLHDIDAIAVELKKFQDAEIPVLWRPLHEAEGQWFWWGAKGAAPFKQLWSLMHDRLTDYHGLHNLIWVYTSSAAEQNFRDWYPGDSLVDVVGADVYTDRTSSMSGPWYDLLDEYDGRKMIALTETGTLPDPALFDRRELRWGWFMPWQVDGSPLGVTSNYTSAQLQSVLSHDDVVTLDELPVTPWNILNSGDADFNHDGSVDGADLLLWQRYKGTFRSPIANPDGDLYVTSADLAIWRHQFGRTTTPAQVAVPEPALLGWLLAGLAAAATRTSLRSEG